MAAKTATDLPDFVTSPDLGALVVLALNEAATTYERNGDGHPASPVLARAYRRGAEQLGAYFAKEES